MQALIFDVDGTLADTETAHLQAFNAAFAEAGRDWFWDETLYSGLLKVAGGKERLLHDWRMVERDEAKSPRAREAVDALHALKTRHYTEQMRERGVPSAFTAHEDFDGALAVLPHLGDPHAPIVRMVRGEWHRWVDLATLRRWHRDAMRVDASASWR